MNARLASNPLPSAIIAGVAYPVIRVDETSNHQTIYFNTPIADPNWQHTDTRGHSHYYDQGYPTLNEIIDASHHCDGTEGILLHDPHESIDELHYECRECGEEVEPGVLPPGTPQTIQGVKEITVTIRGHVPCVEAEGSFDGNVGKFYPIAQTHYSDKETETVFAFAPTL